MKKKFKAESQRLLDMMINSIYTHKEIFLREIISNASDAIDKMCYLALTDPSVGESRSDYEIIITLDKENRTLTVSDNGIGMDEQELEKNLGTIAFSGSSKFSEQLEKDSKEAKTTAADHTSEVDIIGQFGVGFYSAFMVSDKVEVVSKRYGSDKAYKWVSEGAGGYSIEEAEREGHGTDVIMHIRQDGEEADEFSQYMREYPIYKLVKKYSDYIRFPIKMLMPQPRIKEGSDPENPEYEEVWEYEVFNSMVPLWQRRKSEVTKEEYDNFYKTTFQDDTPPLETLTVFVRGVVDSPDLSLNISREMLQHDRQLKLISNNLEKKIRSKLEEMRDKNREEYEKFYKSFGRQLKLCALDDYGKYKEQLQDLLMFWSSTEGKLVTLAEYVSRMKEDQEYIYYATGDSFEAVDKMPQTEVLKDRGIEILYFTDSTDGFIPDMFVKYKEKKYMSVIDGDFDLGDGKDEEKMNKAFKDTFDFVKETLGDRVDVVKATTKLKTHPVCLSSGEGITFEMEKYFTAVNPDLGMKAKRILELNVDHDAFLALDRARIDDPERAKKMCEVLLNQALLIAGLPIQDPSAYTDIICSLF